MSNVSSIDSDVFKALLALDAYNRGYGRGIELLPGANGIGFAEYLDVTKDNGDDNVTNPEFGLHADSIAASFYARAYTYNGETIISYRGTDQYFWNDQSWGDIINGWTLGAGVTASSQGELALQFYNAVKQAAGENTTISVTGHSLGGGLAGFVAGLHGLEARTFDTMTYISSVQQLYNYIKPPILGSEYWYDLVYGTGSPNAPDFSNIQGYFVEGEVLEGALPARTESAYDLTSISHESELGMNALHSQSLLTLLLYGEKQVGGDNADWQGAKAELVTALFDDAIGEAAGAARIDGTSKVANAYADILRTTLAYSMIDGGIYHFGDSGIHALFDDAGDLGAALNTPGVTDNLARAAQALAQSFTQYAGQLAIGKVMAGQGSPERDGILTRAADGSTLSVDYSQTRWRDGMDGTDPDRIVGREMLIDSVIGAGENAEAANDEMAPPLAA
ncbi:hypothetical protein [Saliniramus fredricksonii]|uniref:Uncharacterized protein n=1 Tax=Saliniramus fredricksonii TaxID=1653334 RepID=A0ABY0KAC0_9HYPH|nr:hypothetical protein [Saliniramus fredricksonii]SCC81402.1 hypothetical protein GA0071312_2340 [Saliniramus fredricksonii]